jgi:hypothetical protein
MGNTRANQFGGIVIQLTIKEVKLLATQVGYPMILGNAWMSDGNVINPASLHKSFFKFS